MGKLFVPNVIYFAITHLPTASVSNFERVNDKRCFTLASFKKVSGAYQSKQSSYWL